MKFSNASTPSRLHSLYQLLTQQALAQALRSPRNFREQLYLDADPPRLLRDVLQPWQRDDLAALDPAWQRLAGRGAALTAAAPPTAGSRDAGSSTAAARVVRRAYIERPRGHSKTTDISVQALWILLAARRRLSGLAAAADRDQATLIHRAMQRLADANPELCRELRFVQHLVRHPGTGSQLEVISSDVNSSYGALPDFVICDELCHWEHEALWHSLLSSAAKKPDCVLAVLTNAGIGRSWQWRLREHAQQSPDWHFHSLAGPHAPWITDDALAEQQALLPPPVFERLWLNCWQHSDGEFITLAEAEACRDDALAYRPSGRRGIAYVAAIDYAEKRDFTVGCVCHRDGERVIVDRMDVAVPTPDRPTPVQWVHDWIEEVGARFPDVEFILDPHQLVQTIQQLEGRYRLRRFDFHGGVGNHRLATTLHQLITQRQIAWYAGCGAVAPPGTQTRSSLQRDQRSGLVAREDLETELASLLLKQTASGRIRFDHRQDGLHHDDRAFTLAVAALTLVERGCAEEFFEVAPPTTPGEFAW